MREQKRVIRDYVRFCVLFRILLPFHYFFIILFLFLIFFYFFLLELKLLSFQYSVFLKEMVDSCNCSEQLYSLMRNQRDRDGECFVNRGSLF